MPVEEDHVEETALANASEHKLWRAAAIFAAGLAALGLAALLPAVIKRYRRRHDYAEN